MPFTPVTDQVLVGPRLFSLSWFSVPVSNPKWIGTHLFTFVCKRCQELLQCHYHPFLIQLLENNEVRNPNVKIKKIRNLQCTTSSESPPLHALPPPLPPPYPLI